jgi:hypothetical protein
MSRLAPSPQPKGLHPIDDTPGRLGTRWSRTRRIDYRLKFSRNENTEFKGLIAHIRREPS